MIRIEDNTNPDILPSPGNLSNPPTGEKIADSAIQPSTRSQLQATYCPRKQCEGEEAAEGTRGIEKAAFWMQIRPMAEEMAEEINQTRINPEEMAACIANGDTLRAAKYLAPIDVETFVQWTETILTHRRETAKQLAAKQNTLLEAYSKDGLTPASTSAVLAWAIRNKVETEIASQSLRLGQALLLNLRAINLVDYYDKITERLARDQRLAQIFEGAMKIPCNDRCLQPQPCA